MCLGIHFLKLYFQFICILQTFIDFIVLYNQGITMSTLEDTMLMSYVLDAGKNRHNIDI